MLCFTPLIMRVQRGQVVQQGAARRECLARRGTFTAESNQLEAVVDIGESVLCGDACRPGLDSWSRDLDGASTLSAHKVMVVCGTAMPVQGFAIVADQGVKLTGIGHESQVAIDGGQADPLAGADQVGMYLLGTAKAVLAQEEFLDRLTLTSHPDWRWHGSIVATRYMRTIVITDTVRAMKRLPFVLVGLTTVTLGLSACGSSGETSTSKESAAAASSAQMVATTTVWGDISNQVAECAGGSVTTLMPIGADPHDFTPSSEQVATMVGADLVIANGLGLEEGLESAMGSAEQDGAVVFEVAPLLDPIPFGEEVEAHSEEEGEVESEGEGHSEEEGDTHGSEDPHVWLDANRVANAAELIGAEMAEVSGDAAYQDCGVQVAEEMRALNAQLVETLAAVPTGKRIMVTDHDAFEYFASAYDFEVAGVVIPGGSTLAEPSSAELAALAGTIQETGVPAVFSNTANPTALVDALAAEVGNVEVVELYVGGLGEPGSDAGTYQGMMTTNATRIADALSS